MIDAVTADAAGTQEAASVPVDVSSRGSHCSTQGIRPSVLRTNTQGHAVQAHRVEKL